MNRLIPIFLLTVCCLMGSCTNESKHFIKDAKLRAEVKQDFLKKMQAIKHDIPVPEELSTEKQEAFQFLYAYMPIGDIADYDTSFYIHNIDLAFLARETMPWGKQVPDEIFRHFVLPIRVNNENMDESRNYIYHELQDRVKNLSMYDAVLEVNHWCHEKVTYTPSDSRTSAPLASIKTAYGRCGEESTFTVAALRAVGIPARQVYTPRWAHTDNNHAWVEAWVEGKWYFLGACEPEPVLNLGWFNAPASRGMLMHTKVFGKYHGPEEVMSVTDCYTEINVIDNYAPTAKTTVTVTDTEGNPVSGAAVEFKIYNYAEFYTVANKKTDANGKTFLSAGKGDMLVWASDKGKYGFQKVSFGKDTEITIKLDKTPGTTAFIEMDIVPPVEGDNLVKVTEEQRKANSERLLKEDELRNNYVKTFYTKEKGESLAKDLGTDPKKTVRIMIASRGNYGEIEKFLRETPAEKREQAINLLNTVSAKDLRDTPASVLRDHLDTPENGSDLFIQYIMNPRVSNELLTPYKKILREGLQKELNNSLSASGLISWVKENIQIQDNLNPQQIPVMPTGVWKYRIADTNSRNIFFVAAARSIGIPARIERVTGKTQYFDNQWIDVNFDTNKQTVAPKGQIVASYQPSKTLDDPKYSNHFSIAKIDENAQLQTLNMWGSWNTLLKQPCTIDTGNYMMVTGTRMASGKVLATLTFFSVKENATTPLELKIRESIDDIQVIGEFNSENLYQRMEDGKNVSLLSTTGRGYYVVAILKARQEPTNHALRDIATMKNELEQWGRGMVLLLPNEQEWKNFNPEEFGTLPSTITYGIDIDGKIQKEITANLKLKESELPIFIIADTFNRVVFVSQGYTIGLGEQLMKVIHKL